MGVTKSNKNNISSPKGNSLALFVDYNDGNLKLKDINGNVENFTAYAGSMPVGVLQMEGGVPLDGTLRPVQDQNGNNSPLFLSTNSVTAIGLDGDLSTTVMNGIYGILGGENTFIGGALYIGSQSGTTITRTQNTVIGQNSFNYFYEGFGITPLGDRNTIVGNSNMAVSADGNDMIIIGNGNLDFKPVAINSNSIITGFNASNGVTNLTDSIVISSNLTDSDNIYTSIGIGFYALAGRRASTNVVEIAGNDEFPTNRGSDDGSVYLGYEAGSAITFPSEPTFNLRVGIGYQSMYNRSNSMGTGIGESSGRFGVQIGSSSGGATLSQANYESSVAIGFSILSGGQSTLNVTAIGRNVFDNGGANNSTTAIGYAIGRNINNNTSSRGNTFIGNGIAYYSSPTKRSINSCTYIGGDIAFSTSGITSAHNSNVAIGYSALGRVTTGSNNVAIGFSSLPLMTTSVGNTAIGYESLYNLTQGLNNTAIGYRSGLNLTTGSYTVFLGDNISSTTTTAESIGLGTGVSALNSNHTIIGALASSANFANGLILGKSATATAASQFVVGSASVNAGAVAVESLTSDTTWTVRINGTQYKMLLKA